MNLRLALAEARRIAATVSPIRRVWDREPLSVGDTVPCAYISAVRTTSSRLTLRGYQDRHQVTLRVLLEHASRESSDDKILDLRDALVAAYRVDSTLAGTCLDAMPTSDELGYLDLGNPAVRYRVVEVTLTMEVLP